VGRYLAVMPILIILIAGCQSPNEVDSADIEASIDFKVFNN